MSIRCQDWRTCSASEVAPLLQREMDGWRDGLDWDVRPSWRVIEPARASGALPGFVARDPSNRIVGWTWFLVHRGCLQVAAIVGDGERTVRVLVDAIMNSELAQSATARVVSSRGTPPGLAGALADYGLLVAPYAYRMADLAAAPIALPEGRAWRRTDLAAAAALCARAYEGSGRVRAFAPHGTDEEWRDYVRGLLDSDGCGTMMPEASFVVDGPEGTIAAASITGRIGVDVAHLSQIVVDPDQQSRGLGRRVVRASMAAAAAMGLRRMSLLVAEGNASAGRIYAQLGFSDRARFLVASGSQPRRLTSVALATGGVSTRR